MSLVSDFRFALLQNGDSIFCSKDNQYWTSPQLMKKGVWLPLTEYYKEVLRLARTCPVFAASVSASLSSLNSSEENDSMNWYDPRYAPFYLSLFVCFEIKSGFLDHYDYQGVTYIAELSTGKIVIREFVSEPGTHYGPYSVSYSHNNRGEMHFGSYETLQEAFNVGLDLSRDECSHQPLPKLDYSKGYAECQLANGKTFYFLKYVDGRFDEWDICWNASPVFIPAEEISPKSRDAYLDLEVEVSQANKPMPMFEFEYENAVNVGGSEFGFELRDAVSDIKAANKLSSMILNSKAKQASVQAA